VAAAAPANTARPVLSGTAMDSRTVTTSNGSWTGTPPLNFSYRWLRCDGTGASCVTLAGATGPSYTATAGDVGSRLASIVTATNTVGSASARSYLSATVASSSNSTPSGQPMPVGDLQGWRQVFSDDFTQTLSAGQFPAAVSSRWSAYADGWPDTSGKGTYYPSAISWHDGLMDVPIGWDGAHFIVNAPVPLLPTTLYGRYVVRFKADPVPGYKTAWLLWPNSENWPADGEIDFPEGDLDGTMWAFMHRDNATSGSDQDAYNSGIGYTSWHTAVIEWLPSRCTFILDGTVIGSSTYRIPDTPMHWVLQTETELGTTPSTAAAGHVLIDWVAAYSPA